MSPCACACGPHIVNPNTFVRHLWSSHLVLCIFWPCIYLLCRFVLRDVRRPKSDPRSCVLLSPCVCVYVIPWLRHLLPLTLTVTFVLHVYGLLFQITYLSSDDDWSDRVIAVAGVSLVSIAISQNTFLLCMPCTNHPPIWCWLSCRYQKNPTRLKVIDSFLVYILLTGACQCHCVYICIYVCLRFSLCVCMYICMYYMYVCVRVCV